MSTVTPYRCPIGIIFYYLSMRSCIGYHCSAGLPILSHVYLGNTIASDPKSKITWSISYSSICVVSLISRPVCLLCLPSLLTVRCSEGSLILPKQLSIRSWSPYTAFLSCKNFIQVFRKVANSEGSTYCTSLFPVDFS